MATEDLKSRRHMSLVHSRDAAEPPKPPPLDQPPPGGHDGGMEARVARLEAVLPTLAAKSDVAELRADMRIGFADLRADTHKGFADLRADMNKGLTDLRADTHKGLTDLRADTHKGVIETQRWMVATVLGMMIGFGGMFMGMTNNLKSPPPQQQQAQPSGTVVPITPAPAASR